MDAQKRKIEDLQRQNNRLRAELRTLRETQPTSPMVETVILQSRADELAERKAEIRSLRRHLSNARELIELTRAPSPQDDTSAASTGFVRREMDTLGNYVVYMVDLLRIIQSHDVRRTKSQVFSQELARLLNQNIPNTDLIFSDPLLAFRALAFGFIREHVFESSDIWRDFHFVGMLLRQYQRVLEECST
jgi:hypothetical protein